MPKLERIAKENTTRAPEDRETFFGLVPIWLPEEEVNLPQDFSSPNVVEQYKKILSEYGQDSFQFGYKFKLNSLNKDSATIVKVQEIVSGFLYGNGNEPIFAAFVKEFKPYISYDNYMPIPTKIRVEKIQFRLPNGFELPKAFDTVDTSDQTPYGSSAGEIRYQADKGRNIYNQEKLAEDELKIATDDIDSSPDSLVTMANKSTLHQDLKASLAHARAGALNDIERTFVRRHDGFIERHTPATLARHIFRRHHSIARHAATLNDKVLARHYTRAIKGYDVEGNYGYHPAPWRGNKGSNNWTGYGLEHRRLQRLASGNAAYENPAIADVPVSLIRHASEKMAKGDLVKEPNQDILALDAIVIDESSDINAIKNYLGIDKLEDIVNKYFELEKEIDHFTAEANGDDLAVNNQLAALGIGKEISTLGFLDDISARHAKQVMIKQICTLALKGEVLTPQMQNIFNDTTDTNYVDEVMGYLFEGRAPNDQRKQNIARQIMIAALKALDEKMSLDVLNAQAASGFAELNAK